MEKQDKFDKQEKLDKLEKLDKSEHAQMLSKLRDVMVLDGEYYSMDNGDMVCRVLDYWYCDHAPWVFMVYMRSLTEIDYWNVTDYELSCTMVVYGMWTDYSNFPSNNAS